MAWWSARPGTLADAVQELADHGATCVLLDLHEEPSLDTLAQLSDASPTTPIVVIADGDDEELGVAAVRAGAQDYLVRSELSAPRLARAVSYAVERKRSESALALQALHDPLTALPNRALFVDRLRGALDRSRRTGGPVVVLFLDVDSFKQINDTLGHGAGDRLLMVLAERFRAMLRPMDTVARFGGDEFTFLFEGLESEQEAALVAERITQSASLPLTLGGQQRAVSISIGVYMVTDPEEEIDDVIREADTAMYRAKESGGAPLRGVRGRDGPPAGAAHRTSSASCARPSSAPSCASTTSRASRSTTRPAWRGSRRSCAGSIPSWG